MKHQFFVLRESRRSLLAGSSYSTVRACVVSLIFLLLAMQLRSAPSRAVLCS